MRPSALFNRTNIIHMIVSYLCLFRIVVSSAYWLYIWVTRWIFYKRQELLKRREHLSSPTAFWWGSSYYFFNVLSYCVSLRSEFLCYDVCYDFHIFTSSCLSYLRYLLLFTYSVVRRILCCVFVLFFFA